MDDCASDPSNDDLQLQHIAKNGVTHRLLLGSAVYAFFLLLVGVTTPVRSDHPWLFSTLAASMAASISVRLALYIHRRWLADHERVFLALLWGSVAVSSGVCGVFYVSVLSLYGLGGWTFSLTLLWVVGIGAGATMAATPNFSLHRLHVLLLLGPAVIWGWISFSLHTISFAFATLILLGSLLLQGYRLNTMYWRLLHDRAREIEHARELRAAKAAAEQAREEMRYYATHDPLTGVLNRREMLAGLEKELSRAQRRHSAVGLMMLDIDHFKSVNDRYGHPAGDMVLKTIAEQLCSCLRAYDLVGRYGGEEFLVLLPECGSDQIQRQAERIRAQIEAGSIVAGQAAIHVTVSIGVCASSGTHTVDQVLEAVDQALYRAKTSSRNLVVPADQHVTAATANDSTDLQG